MKSTKNIRIAVWWLVIGSNAFLLPPRTPRVSKSRIGSSRKGNSGDGRGGGGGLPPIDTTGTTGSSDEPPLQPWMALWKQSNETDVSDLRGGSHKNSAENVVKGTRATLASSANYWSNAFRSMTSKIAKPFQQAGRKVSRLFQSKEKRQEEELMKKLQTMPVRRVIVPNSTVLPPDVVHIAAIRSGVLGNPLGIDRVQDFARALKRWYSRKGYVLHSVTGATLEPETATAEIAVQEPKTSLAPVGITFVKEMVVDHETGELIPFRKYKDKHTQRRSFGFDKISRDNVNTTYVETSGRTKPRRIASALGLKAGRHFQFDANRWQRVVSSGIFSRIFQAAPQPMRDGGVQLHIIAVESSPGHWEVGGGRSRYTGNLEGDVEFECSNVFGGGETVGLSVRRGAKDAEPSVRLSYSDDKFGMAGGYDVEIFSDYIGYRPEKAQEGKSPPDYEHDTVLDRKGAAFRVRNPVDPSVMRNSLASASIERTATQTGLHENIGSASLTVGPFVKELPFDARSNVQATFNMGTRIRDFDPRSGKQSSQQGMMLLPYSSVTATTKQILPLLTVPGTKNTRRPPILALRHSLTTTTRNLPLHEAQAQGSMHNIRGVGRNGRVSSALRGTTELRIPIDIPMKQTRQDASVVLFGDWLFARADPSVPFHRKSSIGVGIRKSIQGIPVYVDLAHSKDEKLQIGFGLGRDFDI